MSRARVAANPVELQSVGSSAAAARGVVVVEEETKKKGLEEVGERVAKRNERATYADVS